MADKATLEQRLSTAFAPQHLLVRDDSHKHMGHAGERPEGGTHFHVEIISEKFSGIRTVARHRLVYDALKPDFEQGLHALSIVAKSPEE